MDDRSAPNRLILVISWFALLAAGVSGVAPLVPPAPSSTSGAGDFSVARALAHIERIAQEPRPIGSAANLRARDDITAQLELLGLQPEIQSTAAPGYYRGSPETVEISNVLARIPGTAAAGSVALVGHYDTVPGTPGANDDASAVAIMLEAARAIRAGGPLRHDVLLVFIGAEEPAPRYGSTAFVARHPWAADIRFAINLEAAGSGGPSIPSGMSAPGGWVIAHYARAVPYPVAFSFFTELVDMVGGSNTDLSTFLEAGVAGIELAYVHGTPIYHTPEDAPGRVSARSLQQQGANTLALVRHIANLTPELLPDDSRYVFFTVGRFNSISMVRYPSVWALPIALVAGAVLAVACLRQRAWLRILGSVGATLAVMIGSAAAAIGIWTALAGWRSAMGVAESLLYLAGLLVLTAGIAVAVARVFRRRGQGPDAAGVVIVWWALGLLTAIAAPGMSYLFAWPALAGGLALLGWASPAVRRWQPVLAALVTGTALLTLPPAIDILYNGAQPRPGNLDSQILFIIAIPVILLSLLVELFRVFWFRRAES